MWNNPYVMKESFSPMMNVGLELFFVKNLQNVYDALTI